VRYVFGLLLLQVTLTGFDFTVGERLDEGRGGDDGVRSQWL